jgi:eukaryotic-like serine/threonine-protein kinase
VRGKNQDVRGGPRCITMRVPTFTMGITVTLHAGTKLGDYEILSLLGAGGMGEVYVAHDWRLDRDVAIKILPQALSADAERLRRFEQEARATAALNHPNILAVFQLGTYEGAPYLVSELLEGETLRQRLARGALSVNKVADYCSQIALGLSAAHEKGIVHRDLKPDNLFITRDELVKILDFGLAKLMQLSADPQTTLATVANHTEAGVVLGTVSYMSPEQVRGEDVDRRTDLFSFGCVLYEMATGQQPFAGSTPAVTLSQILEHDPVPANRLNPTLPDALEAVIHKAMEKDRELRYQHASEIRADFQRPKLDTDSAQVRSGINARQSAAHQKRWKGVVSGAIAMVALGASSYVYLRRTPTPLTEKDTIVLSDFANSTGDSVFDDTLKQGLTATLRQSPFLNVLSDNKVSSTLQQMMRPGNTPLTPEITREVCQRADSRAWIGGSIASIGTKYVVGLKAVNCLNGDTLAQEQMTAANKEAVLDALGKAASKLRGALGESLATVKKFDVPLAQAATSSLEALKAASLGIRTLHERGTAAAVPFFQHAVELDQNFASGYLSLGKMNVNFGQAERAKELFTKAYSLRDHASEREKFDIESMYYSHVTGDLENATRVFREWIDSYPRDSLPRGNLANTYIAKGQYEQAAELDREYIYMIPNDVIGYGNLSWILMALNQFPESRRTIQDAFDRKLDGEQLHSNLYSLAFLAADERGMAEQVAWFEGKPESIRDVLSPLESSVAGHAGHLRKARELDQRAVESAERAGHKEIASSRRMEGALREALFGNLAEARRTTVVALRAATLGQDAEGTGALAFALAGDAAHAESLVDGLARHLPQDTLVQSVVLPTVKAGIELSRKNPHRSIELLRTAEPYELTGASSKSCLYPLYVRGEAYLAAKEGTAAATEFQKILDHRGIVEGCETGALAHLGLARAFVVLGNLEKARAAYQEFLALWNDADPDIPVLISAKAEYTKLE